MYKQIFGSPMGSPLSHHNRYSIARTRRESVEYNWFRSTFYHRYVDNIVLAAPDKY